jgi:hypothetical protein
MIASNLAELNGISLVGKKIYTYIYINLLKNSSQDSCQIHTSLLGPNVTLATWKYKVNQEYFCQSPAAKDFNLKRKEFIILFQ